MQCIQGKVYLKGDKKMFVRDKIQYKRIGFIWYETLLKVLICFLLIKFFKGKGKLCKVLFFKETEKCVLLQ